MSARLWATGCCYNVAGIRRQIALYQRRRSEVPSLKGGPAGRPDAPHIRGAEAAVNRHSGYVFTRQRMLGKGSRLSQATAHFCETKPNPRAGGQSGVARVEGQLGRRR